MKLKILLTAIACAVVAGLAWSTRAMWLTSASDTQVVQATEASPDDGHAAVVVLSADKLESAKIKTAPATTSVMQETRYVPGRVQYDDTRHVEVKAAADGVLVQVLVKPGDKVQAGQILATLSSPEIGQARADMLKRRADLAIATRSFDWQNEINGSVRHLIDALAKRPAMKDIETLFSRRTLGDYRTKLLTAYSRLRLAESQAAGAETVATSGAVPSKVIRERLNERERAELEFVATAEQSKFDAQQARDAAEANVEDAQRRYEISQQHLATLLGYNETTMGDNVQQVVGTATEAASPPALLSIVESRAPISGTIERKTFGATERVKQGESLFVVADTSQLWIAADLREQEWSALKLKPNQELKVVSPALPNQTLSASVYYVGPEVTTDSNAVQLVARIDNSAELLRPGLFVRVEVPLSSGAEVLTVPTGAVVEHERSSFVFIEESVGHYRRQDVRIGRANLERVEITSGLEAGTMVVSEGAFVLKSELLLEREE